MQEKWQLVECLTLITPRRHLKTQETLVIPVKTVGLDSKTPAKAIPAVSQFKGDDRLVPKRQMSHVQDAMTMVITLKINSTRFYLRFSCYSDCRGYLFGVWKQFEKGQRAKEAEMALLEASKNRKQLQKKVQVNLKLKSQQKAQITIW